MTEPERAMDIDRALKARAEWEAADLDCERDAPGGYDEMVEAHRGLPPVRAPLEGPDPEMFRIVRCQECGTTNDSRTSDEIYSNGLWFIECPCGSWL